MSGEAPAPPPEVYTWLVPDLRSIMGMQLPVNDLHISFQPAEQLGWFIHHFLPAVEITSHVGESDGGGSDIFLAGQLGILVFRKVP